MVGSSQRRHLACFAVLFLGLSGCSESEIVNPDRERGLLRGRVTVDGVPVNAEVVIINSKTKEVVRTTTNSAGQFEIDLPVGSYSVDVTDRPEAFCPTALELSPEPDPDIVDFPCRTPPGDYEVTFSNNAGTCGPPGPQTVAQSTASSQPDPAGVQIAFAIPGPPVPIEGLFQAGAGSFTTGDVDVGNGFLQSETWDLSLDYMIAGTPPTLTSLRLGGTSTTNVTSGGAPVCTQTSDLSLVRLVNGAP